MKIMKIKPNTSKNTLAIGLSTVLLSACAVGPKYQTPSHNKIVLNSPEAKAFAAYSVKEEERQWWQFLDDANLNQLIATALQHNHDIHIAHANWQAANAMFDESQWNRLPNISANGQYGRGMAQQSMGDGSQARVATENYRLGMDAQWEIDLFGRLKHLSQAANHRATASQAQWSMMRLSIAAAVANQYYQAVGLHQQIQILQDEVDNWQETVKLLKAQAKHGSGLPENVANAQTLLLNAQAALPVAQHQLKQALNRLDVLTGRSPGQEQVWFSRQAQAPLSSRLPMGNVNALIMQRPDVIQAEQLLAASTADVGAATADLYPRLNIGGFLGFIALRGTDIGSAAKAFQLTPSISWPALNLGNAKARLRAKKADVTGALAQYEKSVLVAQEEVENAVTRLVQEQNQLRLLTESAAHSQKALQIATNRHRHGSGSYLSVLENQRAFYQTKQAVLSAQTASYLNVVSLYKALGWGID